MNWVAFLTVIAIFSGTACFILSIAYDGADYYSKTWRNWNITLFIIATLTTALAAGLGNR